jgi:hypothetical protein
VKVEFCYRDQINNLVSSDPKVGFVWFAKTVILFGSEGQVKVFSSTDPEFCPSADGCDGCGSMIQQDNKPTVKVEVAEPLVLNARIKRIHCPKVKPYGDEYDEIEVDDNVAAERRRILPQKNVVVTIGLFSIIKLTRLVQLLIPAFNFCVPNRECIASTDENPCDLFETIDFPFDQFFPPQAFDFPIEEEFEKERRHERREEREEREERRRK